MTNTTAADGFAPCCGAPPKVTEWRPGCFGAQCMGCGRIVGDETQMDEGELREAWNRVMGKRSANNSGHLRTTAGRT